MNALAVLTVAAGFAAVASAATGPTPQTVLVRNGSATLRAHLWLPDGPGPFPAVLVNHGSGRSPEELQRLGPYERNSEILGPVFVRHGYVLLFLFRRGVGPSSNQGVSAIDLINAEAAQRGQQARNRLQLELLENRELGDALAALAYLRRVPGVNASNIALLGASFGGSLTLLMAEREPLLRAAVVVSGAGYSWDRSPELRARLLGAVGNIRAPLMIIHAANDYSVAPGKALDARLTELGKEHVFKIYPPLGNTAEEGHDILHRGVAAWEKDVFAFLDRFMRASGLQPKR